jgi:hypothetical protein
MTQAVRHLAVRILGEIMTSSPVVEIQTIFNGSHPLLSLMEGNLDYEQVVVKRNELAIKAIVPLDLLIITAELYLFEKLVLDPLVEPIAEKFNWVNGVKKLLKPIQPFDLVVQVKGGNFIEAPLDTNHEITAQVWNIIKKTLSILRDEKILDKVSKIRYVPHREKKLLIICYEENRPRRYILLEQNKSVEIPKEEVAEIDRPLSPQEWARVNEEKAEQYRKYMENINKGLE